MKSRHGFVSNSSSSSFIIQWKSMSMLSVDDAVDKIMECCDETNIDIVKKATSSISKEDSIYETTFFTHMDNCIEDFGSAAVSFLASLTNEEVSNGVKYFVILNKRKED